jgi:hypothetical protein
MIIKIPYYDLRRVFSEIKIPNDWHSTKKRLKILGLKSLSYANCADDYAVTNEKKFMLAVVKYGFEYYPLAGSRPLDKYSV